MSCLGPRAPPKHHPERLCLSRLTRAGRWEKAAKQHPVTIYKDYEASLHRLRKDFKENCALQNPKLNQCSMSHLSVISVFVSLYDPAAQSQSHDSLSCDDGLQ